jgi:hypothetical protein
LMTRYFVMSNCSRGSDSSGSSASNCFACTLFVPGAAGSNLWTPGFFVSSWLQQWGGLISTDTASRCNLPSNQRQCAHSVCLTKHAPAQR